MNLFRAMLANKQLSSRNQKLERIRRLFYPKYDPDFWQKKIEKMLGQDKSLLEIGAGSGHGHQYSIRYVDKCKSSLGIDLDERVLENENFGETLNLSAYELVSLGGRDFDLVVSNMVAEHIDDPDKFIENQLAVMKHDSVAIHHTVSKYFYTSILNLFVPAGIKHWLIEHLGSGRKSKDVFPAHYLLNSKSALKKLANKHRCEIDVERYSSPPGYLRRSYLLMLVYIVFDKPLTLFLPGFKPGLIFTIRKKPSKP